MTRTSLIDSVYNLMQAMFCDVRGDGQHQGGVFWQGIKDSQLNEYWLQVLEEYLSRPKELQYRKRAALTLGRHLLQDDQEVYILTGQIQVT